MDFVEGRAWTAHTASVSRECFQYSSLSVLGHSFSSEFVRVRVFSDCCFSCLSLGTCDAHIFISSHDRSSTLCSAYTHVHRSTICCLVGRIRSIVTSLHPSSPPKLGFPPPPPPPKLVTSLGFGFAPSPSLPPSPLPPSPGGPFFFSLFSFLSFFTKNGEGLSFLGGRGGGVTTPNPNPSAASSIKVCVFVLSWNDGPFAMFENRFNLLFCPRTKYAVDPTSEDLMSFVLSHISDDHLQGLKGLGTSSLALGSRCKGTSSSGTIAPSRLTLSASAHLFAHTCSDGGRTPVVFGDTQ